MQDLVDYLSEMYDKGFSRDEQFDLLVRFVESEGNVQCFMDFVNAEYDPTDGDVCRTCGLPMLEYIECGEVHVGCPGCDGI